KVDAILHEITTVQHGMIKLLKGLLSTMGMKRMYWWYLIDSATVRVWMLWLVGNIPFLQSKM
ncbi:hypothetical protein J3R82DRAFT_9356, partial [Butyriboletus roseoflavus]